VLHQTIFAGPEIAPSIDDQGDVASQNVTETFAPGWPGIPARWTSSAKSGLGTSVSRERRVWFTLSHWILTHHSLALTYSAVARPIGGICRSFGRMAGIAGAQTFEPDLYARRERECRRHGRNRSRVIGRQLRDGPRFRSHGDGSGSAHAHQSPRDFDEDDLQHYHTLGGFTTVALGRVPRSGDVFERSGHRSRLSTWTAIARIAFSSAEFRPRTIRSSDRGTNVAAEAEGADDPCLTRPMTFGRLRQKRD
jgi:hypothetical protein